MQNKRDQLQAHLFVLGRLSGAAVRAEPDAPQTPMRRFATGLFGGLMLAVLAVAGFAVYGLIVPGGDTSWRTDGAIVVEKDTGSRYIYSGGTLHPVLNYASALLIAGSSAETQFVSAASLAGVAHGAPVGIPGAPDALPTSAGLTTGSWLVCSGLAAGSAQATLSVSVGGGKTSAEVPADQALVVSAPDGTLYIAWHTHRYRLPDRTAQIALGYGGTTPLPVAAGWINAVAAGEDLLPPVANGLGAPAPTGRVGEVFRIQSAIAADAGFFVMEPDGLAPVTSAQAALQLAAPATAAAYPGQQVAAVPLDPSTAAAVPRSATTLTTGTFPAVPPKAVTSTSDAPKVPCVQLGFTVTGATSTIALAPGAPSTGVSVAAGSGVLAQDLPAPGVTTGTLYLITDLGVRYPLASSAAADALGYSGVQATPIPAGVLALLPTGPALDTATATQTQPITATASAPAAR